MEYTAFDQLMRSIVFMIVLLAGVSVYTLVRVTYDNFFGK